MVTFFPQIPPSTVKIENSIIFTAFKKSCTLFSVIKVKIKPIKYFKSFSLISKNYFRFVFFAVVCVGVHYSHKVHIRFLQLQLANANLKTLEIKDPL